MDTMTQKKYEARAAVMKALAHPTRLYMVEELQKGAQCVCKLQELIGADMSTVSKHLSVLKSAGLVYDKKEGTTVYYYLKMPCVSEFISCVDTVIQRNATEQLEVARCCINSTQQL